MPAITAAPATLRVVKYQDLKPGAHFITTARGMNGHFAVRMWINNEDDGLGVFAEAVETGIGRYAAENDAIREAKAWALTEDLPFVLR